MEYKNNQYLKLDISIEEIAKIKVIITKENKNIEDLEINIEKEEPNVIICYGKENINFYNIYYSVKTIITNKEGINEIWNEIPEYIENIIINNKIYKNNKNKFDFLEFNDFKERDRIINEMIINNKINEVNIVGKTLLMYLIEDSYIDIALKMIDIIDFNILNAYDIEGKTTLYYSCEKLIKSKSIIMKLINKLMLAIINKACNKRITPIMLICREKYFDCEIASRLILKITKENFNMRNNENKTITYIVRERLYKTEDEIKNNQYINYEMMKKDLDNLKFIRDYLQSRDEYFNYDYDF